MNIISNAERQIILDTETTGMNQGAGAVYLGHRIIEVGCVEVINRRLTGRTFHRYINPGQLIDEEAIAVHGITNERVANEPRFQQIAAEFIAFIDGAELVAHNASFDMGFINHEFSMLNPRGPVVEDICNVVDTLAVAKFLHPGQKNNLDALCKRYGIDNSRRTYHGALLDAEILADVYLIMTGGQTKFNLNADEGGQADGGIIRLDANRPALKVVRATADEEGSHEKRLDLVGKSGKCLWRG